MCLLTWLVVITPMQKNQLFEVFMNAFLPHGRSTAEQLSDYYLRKIAPRLEKGQPIYAAFDQDRMIGFAIFEKWEGQNYYLAEMAILPEYQRQGIGKKLVFSILNRDDKAEKILLVTEKGNTSAQAFYEKIGFRRSHFRHPEYTEFMGYEFSRIE